MDFDDSFSIDDGNNKPSKVQNNNEIFIHQNQHKSNDNFVPGEMYESTTGKLFKKGTIKKEKPKPVTGKRPAQHVRISDIDKINLGDEDSYEDSRDQSAPKSDTEILIDSLRDTVITFLDNVFSDKDTHDDKAKPKKKQAVVDEIDYDEEIDDVIYVDAKTDKQKKSVKEQKKEAIRKYEYGELLKQLKIGENTLTAILQEITMQDSMNFSYLRKNVDGSIVFFKDEFGHVFAIPFDSIAVYTQILNQSKDDE